MSYAGNIRNEQIETSDDDGVTQLAAIKRGAKLKTEGFKNPVQLAPFRTFYEIKQPESQFIFRINQDMQMGLFSVENKIWEVQAMLLIKEYLEKAGVKAKICL